MWNAFIVVFAMAAAVSDVGWHKIPRLLTTFGLLAGIGYHLLRGGAVSAGFAAFVGFALGLALFQLGAIGGGDVKLVAALGAILGFGRWLLAMEIAILVAGGFALLQMLRRGALRQALMNILDIVRGLVTRGFQPHPSLNAGNPSCVRAPFGLPVATGTLLALLVESKIAG